MPYAHDDALVSEPLIALDGGERRGAPRVEWPVTADLLKQVSVDRAGRTAAGHARTVNISLTGVLISVPFACEAGEELALRFPLDQGEAMSAVAQVVRVDGRTNPAEGEWVLGCEFVELPVEERCRLAKFLMRRRAAVIDAHARATGRT